MKRKDKRIAKEVDALIEVIKRDALLYLPPGRYTIKGPIRVPKNVTVKGIAFKPREDIVIRNNEIT